MRFLRILLRIIAVIVIAAFIMGVDELTLQSGTVDTSQQAAQSAR